MNRVELQGHLGNDPKTMKNGGCTFSMATNKEYTDKQGENKKITTWHLVKCFKPVLFDLSKGDEVYIEGEIGSEKWNDKYTTWIYPNTIQKVKSGQTAEQYEDIGSYEPEPNDSQSDVPF